MKIGALHTLAFASLCHTSDGNTVGITFEGGGWRAQTAYTGVMSGMLGYLGKHGGSTNMASSGLLDRFDTFASNSGGSWFFSSLAYSESYLSLVESMGANTDKAASQFQKQWTKPVKKALGVTPATFNLKAQAAKELADKTIGAGNADTLWMLGFFLAGNTSWTSFVADQLEAGAGIGADVLMGSAVNSFAENKAWLCSNSVLLPTGDRFASIYETKDASTRVEYTVVSDVEDVPISVPAMFSITMGAGIESSAPHRYMADTSFPVSLRLNYTGTVSSGSTFNAISSPLSAVDFSRGVLTEQAGKLPVQAAASASSAAAGVAPVLGLVADRALAILGADFTPWFTNTATSQSLYAGDTLVFGLTESDGINQDSMNGLANAQVHALIDGGYTDNLGVGNSVGVGADELVVLSDCGDLDTDTSGMQYLFQDATLPECSGEMGCFASPIFAESSTYVKNSYSTFHRLDVSGTTLLNSVVVGTFTATTVDNQYYGTTAGRTITLNVVQMCGNLTIGFFEDIDNYSTYVGEIAQTLASDANAAFVKSTLLPMFTGSSGDAVQFV